MMKFRRELKTKDRLERLARSIEALAEKDARRIREAHEIAELRRQAAAELHAICSEFVKSVNRLLPKAMLELGPPEYNPETLRDPGLNMLQINVSGRIVNIEFEATDELVSTEHFRIPYTLHGTVRCFNQEMLDRTMVPEMLLFYCLEKNKNGWLLVDPRTHRTLPFDQEYLVTAMEKLVQE